MSGTHRDLIFGSKSRCFASKKNRWGLGHIETSNSDARYAVLHVENHRWVLGTTETYYSDPEDAVCLQKPQVGSIHLQRLVILVLKSLFYIHKTTGEGWNQCSLFFLGLSTLLCALKTTDEDWDPYRLVSLVLKALFWMQKPQMRAGTHRD